MIRDELLKKVIDLLEESGYIVAQQFCPGCFDILAKGKEVLLIKILTNIDSFYEEQAEDLLRVANVMKAAPLIVGIMASGNYMKEKTMYERHSIPAVNFETFVQTIVNKKFPFVYAKKGGYYATIDSDFLKEVRSKKNLSLGDLAREAGVSKSSIINYERGKGAEIDNIMRLQDALGDIMIETIDIFKPEKREHEGNNIPKEENKITRHLSDLGFKTATVKKASFKIIGRNKKDILLTGTKSKAVEKRAEDIQRARKTLDQHGMLVLEKAKRKLLSGLPVFETEEFEDVVSSKELLKILKEFEEDY
ncbi:MAG: transcriptional regulator [Candidatus Undinarchaeales archaeon]